MQRMEFELKGLNCANCALKIEDDIKKLDGVGAVQVVFATQKLNIQIEDNMLPTQVGNAVRKVIGGVEPGVEVIESGSTNLKLGAFHNIKDFKKEIMMLATGFLLFSAGLLLKAPFGLGLAFLILAYLVSGADILAKAAGNISRGRIFDENFLMGVATLGALAVGQYPEAAAVMLFYKTGMLLQNMAVHHSRKSIRSLMNLRPEFANLKIENSFVQVDPGSVNIGETILIKPGERVPLDCTIIDGSSYLDTSALTGEPVPKSVNPGDSILAGFINKNGLLTANVTKTLENSAVTRILELVQNAAAKKTQVENFITRFAAYYTPSVVVLAFLTALVPPLVTGSMDFNIWIYRALIFLVISCPCALVISIPLTFFAGIGKASAQGILVKGSSYLEALGHVQTVVFDKTGTLTKGVFEVTGIEAKDCRPEQVLEYAALAEAHSMHPIARSVLEAYGKEIDTARMEKYEEIAGYGVKALIDGDRVLAGSCKLLQAEGFMEDLPYNACGTVVHVAVNEKYMGFITVSDVLKDDARAAIDGLRQKGITNIVMLTGDSKQSAEAAARSLELDAVYSGLLPHQKVEILESIKSVTKGTLLFAGDGINDAPVLARADIGVSMGALGTDAAIEASDIVLMTDEPSKLVEAVGTARLTRRIAAQNIAFALGIKLVILLLGLIGIASMWEAVFADVGVTLIAVFNALRIIKRKHK